MTTELSIRVTSIDDLFTPPPPRLFRRLGRLTSGIDELMAQFEATGLRRPVRVTIQLVDGDPAPDPAELETTLADYCRLRLRDLDAQLRAHRREEIRLFGFGVVLFLLGVLLSAEFLRSIWPPLVQDLLGDGVFLVLAWVGLWYPLDHIIFDRRNLSGERRRVRALSDAELRFARAAAQRSATPDAVRELT